MPITNGQAAEIPAMGSSLLTRPQTHCRTARRTRLTALSTASTSPARVPTSRETAGSDATGAKAHPGRAAPTGPTERDRTGPPPRRDRACESSLLSPVTRISSRSPAAPLPASPQERPRTSYPQSGIPRYSPTTKVLLNWTCTDLDNPHYPRKRSTFTH